MLSAGKDRSPSISQNFCTRRWGLHIGGWRMPSKKIPRRKFLHQAGRTAVALVLLLSFIDLTAWPQPTTTFKIIVPYAAGGGGSVLARLVAEQIERTQMVSVVVENRPQAGTVVGTEAVAR